MDGLKGYVALVSGLTEVTAARAREVATALLSQGGIQGVPSGAAAMATQITGLAEDLLVTARDNRGALLEVVRTEAERAVASVGFITLAEADTLRARVRELEGEVARLRAEQRSVAAGGVRVAGTTAAEAKQVAAKRTTAKRVAAPTKAPATKAPATKAAAKRAPARKVAAPTKVAAKQAAPTKRATTERGATKRAAPARPSTGPDAS